MLFSFIASTITKTTSIAMMKKSTPITIPIVAPLLLAETSPVVLDGSSGFCSSPPLGVGSTAGDVGEGAAAGGVGEGATAGGVGEGATAGGVGEGATAGGVGEGATAGGVDEGATAGGVGEGVTAGGVGEGATAGVLVTSEDTNGVVETAELMKNYVFYIHKVTSVAAPVYQRMLSYSCAVQ